mgnify:CR=1 FL=1
MVTNVNNINHWEGSLNFMKKIISFLLISIMFLGITGCVENSEVKTSNDENSENTTTDGENKTQEITTLKLNEDAFISNEEGEIRLKILSVKETTERNQFSDKQADRVVIIEYEYENKSREDDVFISDIDFQAYDKANFALETYPISVKHPSKISTGRKTTGSMAFALNNDENYIELEFYDNIFSSKADVKFILEW